jgi:hypothetical protein
MIVGIPPPIHPIMKAFTLEPHILKSKGAFLLCIKPQLNKIGK